MVLFQHVHLIPTTARVDCCAQTGYTTADDEELAGSVHVA
jgi:hypothetical protein